MELPRTLALAAPQSGAAYASRAMSVKCKLLQNTAVLKIVGQLLPTWIEFPE